MAFTKEKRAFLEGLLGKDEVDRLEARVSDLGAALKQAGIRYKGGPTSFAEADAAREADRLLGIFEGLVTNIATSDMTPADKGSAMATAASDLAARLGATPKASTTPKASAKARPDVKPAALYANDLLGDRSADKTAAKGPPRGRPLCRTIPGRLVRARAHRGAGNLAMVTETQIRELEAYIQRTMPDGLRRAEPPTGWPYGAEAWDELLHEAREYHGLKAAYDFALALTERGARAHELATGRLDRGAQVANSGQVFRQTVTIPRQLQADAQNALQALFASRANLDPILRDNLERAVDGSWGGDDKAIRAAIAAAEGAVNRKRAEVQAAAQAEAGKVTVHIHRTFRWTGGQQAEPGTYPLTPDQVSELNNWRLRKEATARQHNWDHPEGDGRADLAWPPFTVEGPV